MPVTRIALEEHLLMPDDEHVALWKAHLPQMSDEALNRYIPTLTDVGEARLSGMDRAGVRVAILSHVTPFESIPDARKATRLVRDHNDYMAQLSNNHPDRYAAFASVALQDPTAAADELERAVRELGLKGAMVYGAVMGTYLDHLDFDPFWERAERLGVPVYLHPANPVRWPITFDGRPELEGATWGWTAETASHFLRLIFGGVFDRHPGVQVLLGHMGETLPYLLSRTDSRSIASGSRDRIEHLPSHYLRNNLLVTTSGVFDDVPLRCAIDAIGVDRVMFSIDYPFESSSEAGDWFTGSALSPSILEAVGNGNAERIFEIATA